MTVQIALVLGILFAAVILFITEKIRVDVVALMVLTSLALTGLVTPAEALSGFSNLAVVTVWAVFILSGGLFRTGVADLIGRQVYRWTGASEVRLILVIMLTTSVLSSLMNDIGVAALLLPVVLNLSKKTGIPASKLLMPLAFAALLGGLNTLIGTPPNILVSEALREAGLQPFGFFDYTPVGVALTFSGILFMAFVGRFLLPAHRPNGRGDPTSPGALDQVSDLKERLFVLSLLPEATSLEGRTLAESRIGTVLDLNVLGIVRDGQTKLAPGPDTILHTGDRLIVAGRTDRIEEMMDRPQVIVEDKALALHLLQSAGLKLAEISMLPGSPLIGETIRNLRFRHRFGVIVLAIWRDGTPLRTGIEDEPLLPGDVLLIQGLQENLDALREGSEFLVSGEARTGAYHLDDRLMTVRIPAGSSVIGAALGDSRLAEAYGLTVLSIHREGQTLLMPSSSEVLQEGDVLVVKGRAARLASSEWLEALRMDPMVSTGLEMLESETVDLVEATLSPQSTLVGRTLRDLHFREKYGLNVLLLRRGGKARRGNLGRLPLRFGDTLLLFGPRQMIRVLGSEPDFLVLSEDAQEPLRQEKLLPAVLIMVLVLAPVIAGWVPIAISALFGVVLMMLTGCLTMEEAYRYIEWKAVFLIAGMLPLGIAMDNTGAARFIAERMVDGIGGWGPLAVLAGLYILAAVSSQVMPNPAVAVLLAPIALSTAENLGVSPYPLMMAVALSASAAFLSPVGHSANVLIMGPGGYRFSDYLKVGIPLTLVTLLVTLLLMPIVWPF